MAYLKIIMLKLVVINTALFLWVVIFIFTKGPTDIITLNVEFSSTEYSPFLKVINTGAK